MANYADTMLFGEMFKIFVRYVHIPDEEIVKYCNINLERIYFIYSIENPAILTMGEVNGLKHLMSVYMNRELFTQKVSDDEEDYCWVIGKKLASLINMEYEKRASLTKGVQRKREE